MHLNHINNNKSTASKIHYSLYDNLQYYKKNKDF